MTPPLSDSSAAPPFAQRGRRRSGIAAVILVAWVTGLALLARRELFVSDVQRLGVCTNIEHLFASKDTLLPLLESLNSLRPHG